MLVAFDEAGNEPGRLIGGAAMRRVLRVVPTVLLLLVVLASRTPARASSSLERPRLDVQVMPRVGFTPVTVVVTGRLVGGDDAEEYYCPAIDWSWGDGGRSVQESDCPPFEADTKMARRFTARHSYRAAGAYDIRLTLRRSHRELAVGVVQIHVADAEG